jgi:hypothetical protein
MRLAELVSILRDALLRKTPQDENNRAGESGDPTDGELIEQRRLIDPAEDPSSIQISIR